MEDWKAIRIPHKYEDGTEFRWAVEATDPILTDENARVVIADWLTEDVARLIAAAPGLLEAASNLVEDVRSKYPTRDLKCPLMRALDEAVFAATGADWRQRWRQRSKTNSATQRTMGEEQHTLMLFTRFLRELKTRECTSGSLEAVRTVAVALERALEPQAAA